MAVQFDDLVRQVMQLCACGEDEARRRAHSTLEDHPIDRIGLGTLGPVEAEIFATVLRSELEQIMLAAMR